MKDLLLIGAGGFIGAISRYLVNIVVQAFGGHIQFPLATLFVNVLGCFALGALVSLGEIQGILTPPARAFLLLGFLGAFTTFSTFGYETVALLRDGQSLLSFLNIGLQVALGLVAVWLGSSLVKLI